MLLEKAHFLQIKLGLCSVFILAIFYYIPIMMFSKNIVAWLVSKDFAVHVESLVPVMACASLAYLIVMCLRVQ